MVYVRLVLPDPCQFGSSEIARRIEQAAEALLRSKVFEGALALVVRSRCEVLKASVKALVFGM